MRILRAALLMVFMAIVSFTPVTNANAQVTRTVVFQLEREFQTGKYNWLPGQREQIAREYPRLLQLANQPGCILAAWGRTNGEPNGGRIGTAQETGREGPLAQNRAFMGGWELARLGMPSMKLQLEVDPGERRKDFVIEQICSPSGTQIVGNYAQLEARVNAFMSEVNLRLDGLETRVSCLENGGVWNGTSCVPKPCSLCSIAPPAPFDPATDCALRGKVWRNGSCVERPRTPVAPRGGTDNHPALSLGAAVMAVGGEVTQVGFEANVRAGRLRASGFYAGGSGSVEVCSSCGGKAVVVDGDVTTIGGGLGFQLNRHVGIDALVARQSGTVTSTGRDLGDGARTLFGLRAEGSYAFNRNVEGFVSAGALYGKSVGGAEDKAGTGISPTLSAGARVGF